MRRILVIDDDPETSRLVRTWFDSRTYRVESAEDGESGVRAAHEFSPDLILLDLKMPGLDGISVARLLKGDPATNTVPLIVLTACRDVNAKVDAFAAGSDDYVTKPFAFPEIDARINAMLRRRDKMIGLQSEVLELSHSKKHLEELLMVDDKTGLYNFREFRRRLHEEWARAERYETVLSLVLFDIDDFKQLNDQLGHQAGDEVLADFATLVAGGARANDVAARYGGEEFAVILPHTDSEMALRVAERIRCAVHEFEFLSEENPTRITVSAGVATFPDDEGVESVDALVRAADIALYRAKDLGKNRVVRASEVPARLAVKTPRDLLHLRAQRDETSH